MRVVVGRIGRPHGIRGEVTVEPRTDEPDERFAPGAILMRAGTDTTVTVVRSHWHSGRLLLTLEGVDDRNGAEALRGTLLEVDRDVDELPADDDEFYDTSLLDCSVVTVDGSVVGIIRDIAHLPAQDLLVIQTPSGAEVLVPFVTEIVPEVDIAGRRVVIDPPPGLLDDSGE